MAFRRSPDAPKEGLAKNERFLDAGACTDRVVEEDGALVVIAPPMDEWVVRKHRKLAIVVEGRRWFVAERVPLGPRMIRYALSRWPDADTSIPGDEIVYDEAYVVARDETRKEHRTRQRGRLARWVLQPLYGFAWEGMKRRAHERYGFHPRTVTKRSLYLEWVLLLLCGSMLMFYPAIVYGPCVLLVVDGFIRVSDIFRDTQYPYGFFEWLFRWRKTEL